VAEEAGRAVSELLDLVVSDLLEVQDRLRMPGLRNLIMISGLLRRLIYDRTLEAAAKERGRHLVFIAGKAFVPPVLQHGATESLILTTNLGAGNVQELDVDQFLALQVVERLSSKSYTVVQVIKYGANKRGGIHYDPKLGGYQELHDISKDLELLGEESILYLIGGIAKSVLEAAARMELITL
jgi:hypothetical protein